MELVTEPREKARAVLNDMLDEGYDAALDRNYEGTPIINVKVKNAEEIRWVSDYAIGNGLYCKVGYSDNLTLSF